MAGATVFIPTTMSFDPVLELSVKQLIRALNEKLFMECKRMHLAMPPVSRTLATNLASEVRSSKPQTSPRVLTWCFTGRCTRETSQRRPSRSNYLEKLPTTCQPSPSGGDHSMRCLRLQHRSPTDHPLDPRLPILAQSDYFKSQKLGIPRQQVEEIGPYVSPPCRSSPPDNQYQCISHRTGRNLRQGNPSSHFEDRPSVPYRLPIRRSYVECHSHFLHFHNGQSYFLGAPAELSAYRTLSLQDIPCVSDLVELVKAYLAPPNSNTPLSRDNKRQIPRGSEA